MKFRKKPVVIEAMRFTGGNVFEISRWAHEGLRPQSNSIIRENMVGLDIVTLEGTMFASPGDWIIRGVKGEFYPCKSDIFEATYEAVND